jgi:hypothetical protein
MDTNKNFILEINMTKIGVYIREQFFEARIRRLRNQAIMEYGLIKWKNLSSVEDATWEDEYFIQKHPNLLKR